MTSKQDMQLNIVIKYEFANLVRSANILYRPNEHGQPFTIKQ